MNVYQERIARLREVMLSNGWDAVVVSGGTLLQAEHFRTLMAASIRRPDGSRSSG